MGLELASPRFQSFPREKSSIHYPKPKICWSSSSKKNPIVWHAPQNTTQTVVVGEWRSVPAHMIIMSTASRRFLLPRRLDTIQSITIHERRRRRRRRRIANRQKSRDFGGTIDGQLIWRGVCVVLTTYSSSIPPKWWVRFLTDFLPVLYQTGVDWSISKSDWEWSTTAMTPSEREISAFVYKTRVNCLIHRKLRFSQFFVRNPFQFQIKS